jgi:hypothetical protein
MLGMLVLMQAGVTDPRFTYANRNALELFEASWQELIGQ